MLLMSQLMYVAGIGNERLDGSFFIQFAKTIWLKNCWIVPGKKQQKTSIHVVM